MNPILGVQDSKRSAWWSMRIGDIEHVFSQRVPQPFGYYAYWRMHGMVVLSTEGIQLVRDLGEHLVKHGTDLARRLSTERDPNMKTQIVASTRRK